MADEMIAKNALKKRKESGIGGILSDDHVNKFAGDKSDRSNKSKSPR